MSEWHQKIKSAVIEPDGEDMEKLLQIIRGKGIYQLRSTQLRETCTAILGNRDLDLSLSVRWLLKRMQNAGLPPSYYSYTGLEILTPQDYAQVSSSQVAKNTFRLVHDLLAHLLEVQDLQNHPAREGLERRIVDLLEKCRRYIFPHVPPECPPRHITQLSLIPESHVDEELIFLRVLQCTEVIFNAATQLVACAIELIVYGNVLEAVVALHWVLCLQSLLVPLLRPLASISIECWLEIRPFIELPSAIQSINFHTLSIQIRHLQPLLDHPRLSEEQHRYQDNCRELSELILAALQKWYKAHSKIAAKYGQASSTFKPKGVEWLESRSPLTI